LEIIQNPPNITIAVFSATKHPYLSSLSLYALTDNGSHANLGTKRIQLKICRFDNEYPSEITHVYGGNLPAENEFTLTITKYHCPGLYLCQRAIKNTTKERLHNNKIESSQSFHALTDLEKTMVYVEISKK
jgi:hypothetical protein